MALNKFVKVRHVTNLSEARYCAGMMVDMLGFAVNTGSPYYVDPKAFKEITDWVAGVSFVAECGDMSLSEVIEVTTAYNLKYAEVTTIPNLKPLHEAGMQLIWRCDVDASFDPKTLARQLAEVGRYVAYIVISAPSGTDIGTLEQAVSPSQIQLIKAFDISPTNVSDLGPAWHGIELAGGTEERPGYADYDMMDVLEALDED